MWTHLAGTWDADKRKGEGVYKYANGDVYKGSWSEDVKNGQGSYFFKVNCIPYFQPYDFLSCVPQGHPQQSGVLTCIRVDVGEYKRGSLNYCVRITKPFRVGKGKPIFEILWPKRLNS